MGSTPIGRFGRWGGVVALVAAALAVYWGVWRFELVNFDDDIALAGAGRVADGSSDIGALLRGVPEVFRYDRGREYLPIRDASYLADRILGGGGFDPAILHATNLALHIANGLLVCALCAVLGLARVEALLAGGLFLLHPMQVEAVAWVSGRKDLLATLFALLSWHAFARRRRGLSVLLFLGACLSKATVVTLPIVLALSRIAETWGEGATGAALRARALAASREIAPHAVVAAAIALLQLKTSGEAGMLRPHAEGGPLGAALLAVKLVALYLRNIAWPVDLHLLYAPELPSPLSPSAWLAPLVLGGVGVLAARCAGGRPLVPFGLGAFALLLLPTLGLVPFQLLMADRYAYLPLVGIAVALAALAAPGHAARGAGARAQGAPSSSGAPPSSGTPRASGAPPSRRSPIVSRSRAAVLLLLPLALLARREVPAWRDSEALWRREIARGPRHAEAWANLGEHYLTRGRAAEAADALAQAASRRPDSVPVLTNWALAASRAGRHDEALAAISSAKEHAPQDPQVRYNAVCVRAAAGDIDGAFEDLEEAILDGFVDRDALARDPDLGPLRSDPRFAQILGLLSEERGSDEGK